MQLTLIINSAISLFLVSVDLNVIKSIGVVVSNTQSSNWKDIYWYASDKSVLNIEMIKVRSKFMLYLYTE